MTRAPVSATWQQIELSESYLVCCMFEEAATLASSILRCLCDTGSTEGAEHVQLDNMMESAGMVLVQSLKELRRTSELFDELKALFGSVTAIPVEVLLTGACFQISEGCSSGLQAVLEEFLGKWKYVNAQSYVLTNVEMQRTSERCPVCSVLETEKYLKVAEVYAVTLLGMFLRDTELAITWVEKAELPEEKRQEMLRRLRSLYPLKDSKSSLRPGTPEIEERGRGDATIGTKSSISGSEQLSSAFKDQKTLNGDITKPAISKASHHSHLLERLVPCFWWYRTVTLKFGNAWFVLTQGRIVLWSTFILFIYYLFRSKGAAFKRIALRQAVSAKKALVDAWQLAFSVQVNPLAAVQPLPAAPRGGGR
ncbi:hypothetical protein MRB53_022155 [Persea americana]|uniref:Uncharacterized protein n=1 Tax=Persea americana TaxID=3435 RepID=A0ACC2L6V8_PERAE|nr:hypothetical protein MRB53_022155 [Persea americana]|eukprot:TRINITY_DN11741_c0_g1_i4.p1 TRINITY_DN11741_c0_g1~~TRINITY_DN11741_c0_g1_i4.p1  ORF type:complete len:366 (+),score=70.56 TRINITY_DN11741_c0_g1_i4:3-1100(+)